VFAAFPVQERVREFKKMAIRRRNFLIASLASTVAGRTGVFGAMLSQAHLDGASSRPITAVKVGTPVRFPDNQGDTWVAAWAGDDNLYSPSNDTSGFQKGCNANVAFNRIKGSDALHLEGTTINGMADYGLESQRGPDACTWKSSGCIWIDGAVYLVVARHLYGEDSGDLYRRQTAQNASIIKSTDFGKSWARTAQQNYDNPMFPGRRFATPYFIQYGYGHGEADVDNASEYVYATSNNGFWDCGDDMVLGRVARSKIGLLNGSDWEFYKGGDGMKAAAWSSKMSEAKQILQGAGRFGMTGAVYLPAQGRYFMIGWYYPAGGGKMPGAGTHTVWDFYESPRPWGPWTRIGSYDSTPAGLYSPEVCPKFQDRNHVFAITAGYWGSPEDYRMTMVPLELDT
jgi:hypothetical protein